MNKTREYNQIKSKNSADISLDELQFEIPSWTRMYSFLLNLAKTIQKDKFRADIIICVLRGGCLPARILSDLLENTKLATIAVEFYTGTTKIRRKPIITQPVSVSVKDKKILLVDDVADTGESLKLVNKHLKEAGASEIKVVTIYRKPWSLIVPDYYAKDTCLWIVFPWEIKETVRKIVDKYKKQGIDVKDIKEKLIITGLKRNLVKQFIKEIFSK